VYLLISLGQRLFTSSTVAGWASLIACVLLLNGVTLIILGILGEYVGRIYDETKNRPLYILRNKQKVENREPQEVNLGVHQ
ncbi:MAG: glycosyltransferase, partial [Thermoactinomyces sp.]